MYGQLSYVANNRITRIQQGGKITAISGIEMKLINKPVRLTADDKIDLRSFYKTLKTNSQLIEKV